MLCNIVNDLSNELFGQDEMKKYSCIILLFSFVFASVEGVVESSSRCKYFDILKSYVQVRIGPV